MSDTMKSATACQLTKLDGRFAKPCHADPYRFRG
jgi:hypothetical protein